MHLETARFALHPREASPLRAGTMGRPGAQRDRGRLQDRRRQRLLEPLRGGHHAGEGTWCALQLLCCRPSVVRTMPSCPAAPPGSTKLRGWAIGGIRVMVGNLDSTLWLHPRLANGRGMANVFLPMCEHIGVSWCGCSSLDRQGAPRRCLPAQVQIRSASPSNGRASCRSAGPSMRRQCGTTTASSTR